MIMTTQRVNEFEEDGYVNLNLVKTPNPLELLCFL